MGSFSLPILFGDRSPRTSEGSWEEEPFQLSLQSVLTELYSALCSARHSLKTQYSALQLRRDEYQAERKLRWLNFQLEKVRWQESQQLAAEMFVSEAEVVELDVGGGLQVAITIAVLCKFPESRLAALVRDPLYHKGRVFVDRDPGPFLEVLHYLRTGQLREGLHPLQRSDFERELTYWELPFASESSLSVPETFDSAWCAPTLCLESSNQTVRKKQSSHGIVLACRPLSADHPSIEFQVETSDSELKLFLGLVDRKEYSSAYLTSLQWREAPSSYHWNVQRHELVKTDSSGAFTTHSHYGCACEAGPKCSLGIVFDPRLRTLAFSKNRISQGTAFTEVPEGLFPVVDLWFEAGTVAILQPLRSETDSTAESSLSQITK